MSIVEVKELSYMQRRKNDPVLDNISFRLEKGEYLAVLGNNDSGKTALVRHLNALIKPQSGTVNVCGYDTAFAENDVELRKKCSMIFKDAGKHFVRSTVIEETEFSLRCFHTDRMLAYDKAIKALELLGLRGYENYPVFALEPFDAVRLSIAAGIAQEPEVAIFENIFSGFSSAEKKELKKYLKLLNSKGMSVIVLTEKADLASDADKVLLLRGGKTVAFGKTREILTDRKLLADTAIEMPFALKVYNDLEDAEIKLKNIPLTMEELVVELCR